MTSPQFEIGPPAAPSKESNFGWYFLAFVFIVLIAGQLAYYLTRDAKGEQAVANAELRVAKALELDKPNADFKKPVPPDIQESAKATVRTEIERLRSNDAVESSVVDYLEVVWKNAAGLPVPPDKLRRMAKSDSERWKAAAKIYGGGQLSPGEARELREHLKSRSLTDRLARRDSYLRSGAEPPASNSFSATMIAGGAAIMVGLVVGASVALYGAVSLYRKSWRLQSHPMGEVSRGEASSLALRAGVLLIAMFGGQMIGTSVASMMRLQETYAGLIGFAVAGLLSWMVIRGRVDGHGLSFDRLGFRSDRLGADIVWGVLAAVANWPLMLATMLLSQALFWWLPNPEHPVQQELLSGPTPERVAVILFTAVVLAPLFEETVFRGVLLPALITRLKGPVAAIIVCGLLFAAIHPTGIPAWLTLAEIGAMAGFLTLMRGSLVPALVMHGVHNGILLAVTLLVMPSGP